MTTEREFSEGCRRELGQRMGQPVESLAEKAARLEGEQGKPPAAKAWPAISSYLDECHAQIIELAKDRDRLAAEVVRVRELADKRKERLHRYLDLTDDDWYQQRDAIDAAKSERDRARAIAVTLEQQTARALELCDTAQANGWTGMRTVTAIRDALDGTGGRDGAGSPAPTQ